MIFQGSVKSRVTSPKEDKVILHQIRKNPVFIALNANETPVRIFENTKK